MSGVLGDAERLKFVPQDETLDKIQRRYVFLKDNTDLSIDVREKIIMILYGKHKTVEDLRKDVEGWISREFQAGTAQGQVLGYPYEGKFDIFYQHLGAGELKDWKHWMRYGKQYVRDRWGLYD